MILLHQQTYNPKIDYLVCRNLIRNLPWEHDEQRLRKVYEGQLLPECEYETSLLRVKLFFREHDITYFTSEEIRALYFIITGEEITLDNMFFAGVESIGDISDLVNYIESISASYKDVLFRIALLVNYSLQHNIPIIPYVGICRKLYWSIVANEEIRAQERYHHLIYRLDKYCQKHLLEKNQEAVRQLYLHKDEFLQKFGANQIGVYGSLSTGCGTEYSDLDLLIIFSNEASAETMRRTVTQYWEMIIDIPVDITTIAECEITTKIHPSMQQTLKLL